MRLLSLKGSKMQKYGVKRGLEKNLEHSQLKALVEEIFGKASEEEGKIVASYGALNKLITWPEGKNLCVETQMKTDVSNEVASDTIRTYNTFLEKATGFTSKQRSKRLQDKAKKGSG